MKFQSIAKTLAITTAALCAAAAQAEIKIGFTAPMSGPVAAVGQDQYDGFMLGIDDLGKKLGGEAVTVLREDDQQMLAIGRALMTNPRLVVLDEATEGLAPLIRTEIWRALG